MKSRLLHTPDGVRDLYNGEYKRKLLIQEQLHNVFMSYGCFDIQTPTFEYFDVFSNQVGTTPSKDLFKFFDKEGNTVVLRPDFTPSIARCVAKYYAPEEEPVKLCYMGNTFINSSDYQGRLKESTQCGVEFLGDGTAEADAQMLSMVVDSLKAIGLENFQISVGHAGFFNALLEEGKVTKEQENQLRELLANKNFLGVEAFIENLEVSDDIKQLFALLAKFDTSSEDIKKARIWATQYPKLAATVANLEALNSALQEKEIAQFISFELGKISVYEYYTGIIFAGYTFGHGEPIVKGGRYDKLLSHFGKDAPAIGFAFVVDQLLAAIKENAKTKEQGKYITFALGKGRLAKKTLKIFEQIGITCEEIYDPDTRKLIFVNEDLKLRFFLAKGPDVPTYVEHGAADIGIVGKDTILEEGRNVYEVLDLGFGNCRMCICGPESAKELLQHQEQIRVATKYPQIAKEYFYNEKNQTVEIIKLNGSIELAPIVGLSDVICDIVETGATLRENGLVVLEEVCNLSARMIVNQVSMKMQNERITKLIRDLKNVLS
ncbi:MAG: ATP phosphoribosyltransferase regulatory subunit [Lachnospiraceae bacterium]|nr:ATP phosphoribosyltransferase regulatory subunit [Lachnospiraceae bacterium]